MKGLVKGHVGMLQRRRQQCDGRRLRSGRVEAGGRGQRRGKGDFCSSVNREKNLKNLFIKETIPTGKNEFPHETEDLKTHRPRLCLDSL